MAAAARDVGPGPELRRLGTFTLARAVRPSILLVAPISAAISRVRMFAFCFTGALPSR